MVVTAVVPELTGPLVVVRVPVGFVAPRRVVLVAVELLAVPVV
ncbi:hypothetical protein GCM10009804_17340 [Kribbella hippodromi]|uniref:Uncharacterized protein n=1 Tax=Kribbella hippodromi TaxID=434347 RepID=A0ABN2CP26_9ACTN